MFTTLFGLSFMNLNLWISGHTERNQCDLGLHARFSGPWHCFSVFAVLSHTDRGILLQRIFSTRHKRFPPATPAAVGPANPGSWEQLILLMHWRPVQTIAPFTGHSKRQSPKPMRITVTVQTTTTTPRKEKLPHVLCRITNTTGHCQTSLSLKSHIKPRVSELKRDSS